MGTGGDLFGGRQPDTRMGTGGDLLGVAAGLSLLMEDAVR